jgi:microcystin-dependent protein
MSNNNSNNNNINIILDGYNNLLLSNNIGEIKNIGFPTGMVVIWRGTKQDVPYGWSLCNGKNGTPDLRGQFIRMYSDDIDSSPPTDVNNVSYNKTFAGISNTNQSRKIHNHTVYEQGGSDTRILTVPEFPKHSHPITFGNASNWGKAGKSWFDETSGRSPIAESGDSSIGNKIKNTEAFGLSSAISQNNQPPYYVLSFIMKIDITEEFIKSPPRILQGNSNIVLSNQTGNIISLGFPKGMIVIWSGTRETVPIGWTLCNGQNGTPDLRGQFVRMYSDDITTSEKEQLSKIKVSYGAELAGTSRTNNTRKIFSHKINEKGGSDIIISRKDEIPSHSHNIDWGKAKEWSNTRKNWLSASGRKVIANQSDELSKNVKIENVGRFPPLPQNNQPPYYVIAFIMKL